MDTTIISRVFNLIIETTSLRKSIGMLVGIEQEFARAPKMVTRPAVGKERRFLGGDGITRMMLRVNRNLA